MNDKTTEHGPQGHALDASKTNGLSPPPAWYAYLLQTPGGLEDWPTVAERLIRCRRVHAEKLAADAGWPSDWVEEWCARYEYAQQAEAGEAHSVADRLGVPMDAVPEMLYGTLPDSTGPGVPVYGVTMNREDGEYTALVSSEPMPWLEDMALRTASAARTEIDVWEQRAWAVAPETEVVGSAVSS